MADIDFGQLSEALNDKSDRDLRNVDNTAGADAVIDYQEPTADNGYTWYRKYKSGWVEQGGGSGASNTTISLPIAMSNSEYAAIGTVNSASGITQAMSVQAIEKTTTTIKFVSFQTGNYTVNWQVSGKSAN